MIKKVLLIMLFAMLIEITGCTMKNTDRNYTIIDKTKDISDFVCASALEEFYKDDTYKYYYNCIKGNYIVVRYEDLSEELVSDALKNSHIKITDLDNFGIDYYKEEY